MDTTVYPFRIEKFSFLSAKLYTISPTLNQISLFPPRLSNREEYGKLNLSFYSTLFTYTTLLFFLIDCRFPQVSRARSTRPKMCYGRCTNHNFDQESSHTTVRKFSPEKLPNFFSLAFKHGASCRPYFLKHMLM